ncbi:MAG: phosphoribosylformylglycinamidine synthase subunit PurQ [Hyphomicrobiales bacterium]
MEISIIRFPGTNCEVDTYNAVKKVLGKTSKILSCKDTSIPKSDLIIIPGGFSYGDYLRSGAIAAREPIMSDLIKKAKNGVNILGICNGFQILTECNLLPGALLKNNTLKFISKITNIQVTRNDTFFSKDYDKNQSVKIPVAHHDGNYFVDQDTLKKIEQNEQVAMRYAEPINGSLNNIAGLYNDKFNILGMMPHPERAIDTQTGTDDGIRLFQSMFKSMSL